MRGMAMSMATNTDTASAIVRRDASGSFSANVVAADGGYHQPGTGGETIRIVKGLFYSNPISYASGTGYTVVRNSTGTYTVTFSTGFSNFPSTTVTLYMIGYPIIASQGLGFFLLNTYDTTGVLFDPVVISFISIGPP